MAKLGKQLDDIKGMLRMWAKAAKLQPADEQLVDRYREALCHCGEVNGKTNLKDVLANLTDEIKNKGPATSLKIMNLLAVFDLKRTIEDERAMKKIDVIFKTLDFANVESVIDIHDAYKDCADVLGDHAMYKEARRQWMHALKTP